VYAREHSKNEDREQKSINSNGGGGIVSRAPSDLPKKDKLGASHAHLITRSPFWVQVMRVHQQNKKLLFAYSVND
jgi:hypothetical protein